MRKKSKYTAPKRLQTTKKGSKMKSMEQRIYETVKNN